MLAIIIVLGYFFVFAKHANAYLDPGSGSYIFQMSIGFFLTGMYIFRTFLKNLFLKIKNLLIRKHEVTQKRKGE
jgi:hypothetical protein